MDLEINVSELIGVLDFYGRVLDTITVTERVNLEIVWHLELQPGPGTGTDTLIYSANANTDYGAFVRINSGSELATVHHRGIVKFDLSSIPANSTIRLASAKLYCETEASTTDRTVNFHRSLVQWFEGSGSAVTPPVGDASVWNYKNYNGSVAWGAAGGQANTDYVSSATAGVSITGTGVVFSWNVIADIQRFADGAATNYGWWLINASQGTANSYKGFTSSAGATTANRPLIILEWRDSVVPAISENVTVSESVQMWIQPDNFVQIYIQPDAATGMDTTTYDGANTTSYGLTTWMRAGGATYGYQSFIQFDLTSVPVGSTFVNGYMDLYCESEANTTPRDIGINRMILQWWEGQQNGTIPGAGLDASVAAYRNYNGSVAWGTAWISSSADTQTVSAGKWIRFDLSQVGQYWCDGQNFGLRIYIITYAQNTYKAFSTSDSGTAANRPKLTFTYRDSLYINVSDSVTVSDSTNTPTIGYVTRLTIMSSVIATADTQISADNPDTNYGNSTTMGTDPGVSIRKSMIRFDFSAVPADAVIQDAILWLYLYSTFSGGGKIISFYRMLVAWNEATATWNVRDTGIPWGTAGAQAGVDYEAVATTSKNIVLNGQYWSFPHLGRDVSAWVAGEVDNNGWLFWSNNTVWCVFYTSDAGATVKPFIYVDYFGTGLQIAVRDDISVSESMSFSETLAAVETITVTEDSDVFVEPAPVGLARTYTVFIA